MAIPGYRWVRGLVREHRYEQALKQKGDKTWDEWLDERIAGASMPAAPASLVPPTSTDATPRPATEQEVR